MLRGRGVDMPESFWAEMRSADGPGCILMADLSATSATLGFNGAATVGQCKSICRALAKMHVSPSSCWYAGL